jgi:asparagine synthase (glutamine-hydrolysing)
MCGIAGILNSLERPVDAEDLAGMCAAMVHRGPDDEGFYRSGAVGLGMRRLSIIDLETGRQPVHNEDGSIWAVFNGEIYNFKELRRDLEARGHAFYTATDTETIVHLYEEHGERCAERMRGMFTFAVWDGRKQTLLLARDRVGIKPLYYAVSGDRFLFASELKAILQVPGVERRINWHAFSHLATFMCTPATESIIDGIEKLEPAHVLTVSPGREPRLTRYWDLDCTSDHSRTEEEVIAELRDLLDESVRLHLVSDVPLGAFLSGGVDSSSVVATMARLTPGRIKTFSIGFKEADYDELPYARQVARELGTEHHELVLEPDVVGIVQELAWHLDEPFGDSSAIPTYMVSKLASEHVKVALSGDGGDELFAGYDRYRVEARERIYERVLAPVRPLVRAAGRLSPQGMKGRNLLRHLSLAGAERYLDAATLFRRDEKAQLFHPDALARCSGYDPWHDHAERLRGAKGHWLSALQYLEVSSHLALDILTKVDRASMAHSLEARVPLLDHKLIEFAAAIPPGLKLRKDTTKYIFKRALEDRLPAHVLHRPKKGFAIPLGRWFRGPLGEFARELLLSARSQQRGVFNAAYIERLLKQNDGGRDIGLHLWTLLSFELWCRAFLDPEAPRPAGVRDGGVHFAETNGGEVGARPAVARPAPAVIA